MRNALLTDIGMHYWLALHWASLHISIDAFYICWRRIAMHLNCCLTLYPENIVDLGLRYTSKYMVDCSLPHRIVMYLIHWHVMTPGSLSLWRMQWQCIGTQGANLARGICAFLAWGFPRTWALTDLAPGARCSMIHLEWHTTYWVEWLWPICTVHCLPSYPLQNLTCMPKAQRPKSQRVLRL